MYNENMAVMAQIIGNNRKIKREIITNEGVPQSLKSTQLNFSFSIMLVMWQKKKAKQGVSAIIQN
jgi:hypothetical protein